MSVASSGRIAARVLAAMAVALPLALGACSEQASVESKEVASAPPPPAQAAADSGGGDSPVYRGAAVAQQVCAQCHDIGAGSGPVIHAGAPTFVSVIEKPETTAEGLAAWLKSSHPSMPHYVFNDAEVADLVAYIMSLRTPR
jgi:mono/diheme cytochrome c family protein